MTESEKRLLLQDLCARLPYKLYVTVRDLDNKECEPFEILGIKGKQVWVYNRMLCIDNYDTIEVIRPFLRTMSSMTEEEKETMDNLWKDNNKLVFADPDEIRRYRFYDISVVDFLNSNHFDYRGLIEKGLALEAPEGMYNTKTE